MVACGKPLATSGNGVLNPRFGRLRLDTQQKRKQRILKIARRLAEMSVQLLNNLWGDCARRVTRYQQCDVRGLVEILGGKVFS